MSTMSHRARAAVLEEKDGPFVWQDIEIDDPRPDEVLVRMVATGICATDAHVRRQKMPVPLPVVLGHEGAGVVERLGSAVTGLEPGDHVALSYHFCGRCPPCLSAHPAYCDLSWEANFAAARLDGTQGLHRTGTALHGHFFGQSSFATHALTHQRNTVKIPSDIPLELAAPLGCGLQTGAGTVLRAFSASPGMSIGVIGVGAVGLAAVMAGNVVGARTVVAVDVDAARLDLARDLGATHVIDVRDTADLSTALRGVTSRGLDIVLETSGRAENLTAAVDSLAPRGRVGIVTFEQGAGGGVTSPQLALGRSVHGIAQGDAVSPLFLNTLADLWRAGRFPVDRLVTSYDADDINLAFDDAAAGRVIKAVLRFPG